jgi:hypothetical protein
MGRDLQLQVEEDLGDLRPALQDAELDLRLDRIGVPSGDALRAISPCSSRPAWT